MKFYARSVSHFVEKRVVAWRNVGCFLQVTNLGTNARHCSRRSSLEYVSRDILAFANKDVYFSERFLFLVITWCYGARIYAN